MKKINYIGVLVAYLTIFSSCVKEDNNSDDCPPVVSSLNERILHFKTLPDKYTFENHVESVILYVYDKDDDDQLVAATEIDSEVLAQRNYQLDLDEIFDLPYDNYHVMAVMNYSDDYVISGEQKLSDFEASFHALNSDTISHRLSDVFIGDRELTVPTRATVRDTVELLKLTNHIYLTVEFNNYVIPTDHQLEAHIYGANAHYNYKKECTSTTSLTYMPHGQIINGESIFKFDITTGQLWLGDGLRLYMKELDENKQSTREVSMYLTDEIAKIKDNNGYYLYDTNEKLMMEDEFYLYIVLDSDFAVMELRINNWFVVRPDIDL